VTAQATRTIKPAPSSEHRDSWLLRTPDFYALLDPSESGVEFLSKETGTRFFYLGTWSDEELVAAGPDHQVDTDPRHRPVAYLARRRRASLRLRRRAAAAWPRNRRGRQDRLHPTPHAHGMPARGETIWRSVALLWSRDRATAARRHIDPKRPFRAHGSGQYPRAES